jgi:aminoglycoside phosphotransferase (APT) family kinase protein
LAGHHEVVCHGDLSPWNTVYDDRGAVAFIDWDNARPGERREDVGYAVWRFLMLGFPAAPPLDAQRHHLQLVADTYGRWQPSQLIEFVAEAQRSQHDAFHAALAAGDERIRRLVELGALDYIEGAQAWLDAHAENLL